ncbi:hypothetical protein Tco_0222850 [Tanacetum coccineum]
MSLCKICKRFVRVCNPDSVSRSLKTSDLILEVLTAEIGLEDSIPTEIDDGYYDSEGDILFLEYLLIEETFFDPTPAVLPKESTLLVTPLPDPKQICLSEVGRFDPFFSLTQSGNMTRVVETPSLGFHHMPSPRPAAYSPKEIPSGESKVHIEVLLVLWGNRLPIPDGSLPLSRYKGLKTKKNGSEKGLVRGSEKGSVRGSEKVSVPGDDPEGSRR